MISVIIPTLNEEGTIGQVVRFAKKQPSVTEVIVVDDRSFDNTVSVAQESGAKVMTSTKLGKGASMKDGILYASNQNVVFLDGDIDPYPPLTIKKLAQPLIDGKADFVKSNFSRSGGRVTELVAKPLLSIFFPELMIYSQPLSGMIAGKKSLLQKIEFSDDYGVDIGILIDMHLLNAKIKQVNIGGIKNKSKPWHELGKMSREVAHTIIKKASEFNRDQLNFEDHGMISEIRSQLDFPTFKNQSKKPIKLIVFDMDNTILQGSFIDECAKRFHFVKELSRLRSNEKDPVILTKHIAGLLKGINVGKLTKIIDEFPIVPGTKEVINKLKELGCVTGIISDSYDFATNHIKQKLGMDFSFGNELEFSKGVCSGEVKIPAMLFKNSQSVNNLAICKTNVLRSILKKFGIKLKNCIAVGDGKNDLWMIKEAGLGVAFCSKDKLVNYHADVIINKPSFEELLGYV